MLFVDSAEVPAAEVLRYMLRWYSDEGAPRPVLYRDGKRVTAPWRVVLDHAQDRDPFGENANTA